MRYFPAITALLLSSAALTITPAQADDMLTSALKKVSELEAKNIALEVNQRRLEEEYKALKERNNKLEQSYKAKEASSIKAETKPRDKLASKAVKEFSSLNASASSQSNRIEEITKVAFEGAYIGVNGGYGGGDITTVGNRYFWTNSSNIRFSGPETSYDNSVARAGGALAGGQFGYNYVFQNNFIAGLEFDFDWTDIGSQANNSQTGFLPPKGAFFNSSSRTGLNWLSTERIKFGYSFDRFMPYVTGGLAIAQSAYSENGYNLTSDTSIYASSNQGGKSKVGVGWSAGAGIEYALLKNLSVKTEYLYSQTPGIVIHNSSQFLFSNVAGQIGIFTDGSTANLGFHQIRIGLNYHPHFFNQSTPAIIAKY